MEPPVSACASVIGRAAVLNLCVCLAACGGGGGPSVHREPPTIRIKISPASATLLPGEKKQFRVSVSHSANSGVTWSVDGGEELGTISSEGTYTAPDAVPAPDTLTIRATSTRDPTKTALAKVKILAVCSASEDNASTSRTAFSQAASTPQKSALRGGYLSTLSAATELVIPAQMDKYDCSVNAPGDVLTLAAGVRGPLTIRNCNGTAADPIVIRNDPAGTEPSVISRASGPEDGFVLYCQDCTGVTIDGSYKWLGAPSGKTYGIKVTMTGGGSPSAFVKIGGLSRFVTIRNVEIDGAWPSLASNGIGISVNDHSVKRVEHPDLWREGILIADNYVHNVEGEGMYVGPNYRDGDLPLRNIEIRYNRVEDTGWDGINTKSLWAGENSIHHNQVRRAGQNFSSTDAASQYSGIMNNAGTVKIHNNWIESTGQHGIQVWTKEGPPESEGEGPFETEVWNNVIVNAGALWQPFMSNSFGISIGAQPGCEKPIPYVYNNTIVGSRESGIGVAKYVGAGFVRDNVIAGAGGKIAIFAPGFVSLTNNRVGAISELGFENPELLDFHLRVTSPSWNQGSSDFPPTDFDDEARPRDGAPDPGAFEGTD